MSVLSALAIGLGFFLASQLLPENRASAVNNATVQTGGFAATATVESIGTLADPEPAMPFTEILPLRTSIIFGGDAMLSRVVGQKMVKYKDFSWPFLKVKDTLSRADLAVINLESPFTLGSKSYTVPTGSFSFNADPRALAGLKSAGIDVVTLANNHFANQGKKGMLDTYELLDDNNIYYVGAGMDLQDAHQGEVVEKNGIKFGFLGYGYPDDNSLASADKPGIAGMDLTTAEEDVTRMKTQADVVIILLHDGVEYTNLPSSHQKEFARAMIAAGADLVVGHHPHWVQQVEIYRGKPIIYSLGNLVFDQMWSVETREGSLVRVDFSGGSVEKLEFMPLLIQDYGQAEIIAAGEQKNKILRRMGLKDAVMELE